MNLVAVSLEAVNIVSSLVNKAGIFLYALLNVYARDG